MKHISRKIFLSVGVLCLAIVAFATTTFAWFTLSTTAKINDFTMSIETSSNLSLRATVAGETPAENYSSIVTLPTAAFAKPINQLFPIVYDTNSTPAVYKSMDKTTHDLSNISGVPGTNKMGYIQIKLEFQTNASGKVVVNSINSKSSPVAFTSAFTIILKNGKEVKSGATFNSIAPVDGGGEVGNYVLACNALRTQFFSSKVESGADVIDTLIWQYISHSGEGEGEYGTTSGTSTTGNTALTYFNGVTTLGKYVDSKQTLTDKFLKTIYKEATGDFADDDVNTEYSNTDLTTSRTAALTTPIVSLTKATGADTAKATAFVRVWIDGWDADCFNAVLLQKIVMNLSFEFLPA